MSRRLNELKAGEQLLIDADVKVKTGHLGYGALLQSQLVLSEKAGSTKRKGTPGKIASGKGIITAQNGFNCTPGQERAPEPLHRAQARRGEDLQGRAHAARAGRGGVRPALREPGDVEQGRVRRPPPRSGDFAKILKGSKITVTRYGPEFQALGPAYFRSRERRRSFRTRPPVCSAGQ